MDKETIEYYANNYEKVKIRLKNRLFYTGTITNTGQTTFLFKDKYETLLAFDYDFVVAIEPA